MRAQDVRCGWSFLLPVACCQTVKQNVEKLLT